MATICVTGNCNYMYLALEDTATGNQFIAEAMVSDLTTWAAIYDPAAGTAGNVIPHPANPDVVIFYGNFGTDVTVLTWDSGTRTLTDISPASLGAKVVNTCAPNPNNEDEIIITVDTDQDLLYTSDGGTTWTAWDAALGFNATALAGIWSSQYAPHRYMVGGDNTTDLDVLYSPNQGNQSANLEGASLGAQAAITNIEVVISG